MTAEIMVCDHWIVVEYFCDEHGVASLDGDWGIFQSSSGRTRRISLQRLSASNFQTLCDGLHGYDEFYPQK